MPLQSSLGNRARLHLKKTKISRAWWLGPIVPATQQLRQENCFNPEGRSCGEAEIVPLHSSLGDRARLCLKQNKTKNKPKSIPVSQGLCRWNRYCIQPRARPHSMDTGDNSKPKGQRSLVPSTCHLPLHLPKVPG